MKSPSDTDDLAMRLPDLREFAAVGQDRAAVARLYGALLEDLDPQNLVERMWIRDIALLTVRSEELRLVQLAVHKVEMNRSRSACEALPAAAPMDQDQRDNSAGEPAAESAASSPVSGEVDGSHVELAVGHTYAESLEVISNLAVMEMAIRRDRDRILEQFNLRRRSLVLDIVTAVVETMKAGT